VSDESCPTCGRDLLVVDNGSMRRFQCLNATCREDVVRTEEVI